MSGDLLARYRELTVEQATHQLAADRLAAERAAVLASMNAAGQSYAAIAAATGLSRARVQQLIESARSRAASLSAMPDAGFWAEAASLLAMLPEGVRAWYALADYMTDEAERRDPELLRLRREHIAIFETAQRRAGAGDPLALDSPAELTESEEQAVRDLSAAYEDRFRARTEQGARVAARQSGQ